jgi:hypothetical protein
MYVSFRPSFAGPEIPAWISGWTWHDRDWCFRVCRRRGGRWVSELQHPRELIKTRAFEPSTAGLKTRGGEVRRFEIRDVSSLSALLEPREVLGQMLRDGAACSQHAIYVHESEQGKIYFPAWLLIDHLLIWSPRVLRALFMPNSLDLLIQSSPNQVLVSSDLVSGALAKSAESRIRWLAVSQDARASWASVLMNAYEGRIDLLLPKISMRGWLWGAHVRGGLLACELSSVCITSHVPELQFLAVRNARVAETRAAPDERNATRCAVNHFGDPSLAVHK